MSNITYDIHHIPCLPENKTVGLCLLDREILLDNLMQDDWFLTALEGFYNVMIRPHGDNSDTWINILDLAPEIEI